jgi:SH3-like domain-containing protein
MKNLFILTLILASLAVGCQNADVTQTPQAGNDTLSENANPTPETTNPQTPSNPSKTQSSAAVQSSPVLSQQTCQISAFVIDEDPKGLNVRSEPSKDSQIIGNLPTNTEGVIVDLDASQGDWVQLTKAESPQKIEFQGKGWIYAQLLGTSTRGYGTSGVSVYKSASEQSAVMGQIPPQKGVKLLGCSQAWAWVEYQGIKGWISPEAQCPNPLTTCP